MEICISDHDHIFPMLMTKVYILLINILRNFFSHLIASKLIVEVNEKFINVREILTWSSLWKQPFKTLYVLSLFLLHISFFFAKLEKSFCLYKDQYFCVWSRQAWLNTNENIFYLCLVILFLYRKIWTPLEFKKSKQIFKLDLHNRE